MNKQEKEEASEEPKEVAKSVTLVEVPTQFGLAYQTPDGVMSQEKYLEWIGNLLLEVKQGLVG